MPEVTPFKEPGASLTFKATAAVTGGRFVRPSGNRTGGGGAGLSSDLANLYQMAHCGAGQKPAGVARYDVASGALGKCETDGVQAVTAGAAIAAGDEVMSDATGQAIVWVTAAGEANRRAGLALTGAANGATAEVQMY